MITLQGRGNVTARLIYGVWKFAEGWGLKVGKDYTPITFFLSNQVFDTDNNLEFGQRLRWQAWAGRSGRYFGPGTLKFAAVTPTTRP